MEDCIPFNLYFTLNTNSTRSHQLSLLCPLSRVNSCKNLFIVNAPTIYGKDVLIFKSYSCFKIDDL